MINTIALTAAVIITSFCLGATAVLLWCIIIRGTHYTIVRISRALRDR